MSNRLRNLPLDDQHGLVPDDGWLSSPDKGQDDQSPMTEAVLWRRLADLAPLLNYKTMHGDRAFMTSTWACLADISRDLPILRALFGLRRRPSLTDNEKQLDEAADPDCILEAARRLLDPAKTNLMPSLRKQAFRTVANCCADNNVNRALVVGREGIQYLKTLTSSKQDLDVLLPTLYNICVDYDEMVMAPDGAQLRMNRKLQELGEDAGGMTLTVAEQILGKFSHKLEKTSIETFLTLWPEVDLSQHPVLADIIEMASRSALFGVEQVLETNEPSLIQSRLKRLFDALGLEAQNFDEDAREALLQTYFNLLTQPPIQEYLAQSPEDLKSFVIRLYGDQENFIQNDIFPAAFLKLSYAISSVPAYAEANGPDSDFIIFLVHLINKLWQPIAPTLVLLSNSLTSIDRISRFQASEFYVERTVVSLLEYNRKTADILIPALSFSTRFALTSQGQTELYSARVFPALSRLLSRDTYMEHTLEIHRESLALARLVVKSQPKHAKALLTKDLELFTIIVNIASKTIDASSKLEAGRFVVEILRTLLARGINDATETTIVTTATGNPTATSIPLAPIASENRIQNSPDLARLFQSEPFASGLSRPAIATILYIITDAPSSATRAEGLFGLALLSTLPTADIKHSTIEMLGEQKENVLPVLNDIVASTGQADRKAEVENLKFLLSQLLRPSDQDRGQESLGAATGGTEQEIFKHRLRDLAGRLGINIEA